MHDLARSRPSRICIQLAHAIVVGIYFIDYARIEIDNRAIYTSCGIDSRIWNINKHGIDVAA